MVGLAYAGVSADRSIYNELEPRMTKAPSDLMVAYEQAAYFIAVGARRADYDGNDQASDYLLAQLTALNEEASAVEEKISLLCSYGGVMCPKGGSAKVLSHAIEAIESSDLSSDDQARIVTILKSNKRAVQIRRAIPWIALVGVGAAAGTWWWRSRR
jgi:hypothetical protein